MNHDMQQYYSLRASEYDRIYDKPERQAELARLKSYLSQEYKGLDVLEIACGTGYWTQYIARSAKSILATDINLSMLRLARNRDYRICYTGFIIADAYSLAGMDNNFSGGFAGFIWSHIPVQRRAEFLNNFNSHLISGAKVIFIDGRYVEGSSTPIYRQDEAENTYQIRTLDDGSIHEVVKNYPSAEELRDCFAAYADNFQVNFLQYFWVLSYSVK